MQEMNTNLNSKHKCMVRKCISKLEVSTVKCLPKLDMGTMAVTVKGDKQCREF